MNRRTFLSHSGRLFVAAGSAPRMFADNRMPEYNQRRSLSFSNDWMESTLATAVREMPVEDPIVVNLSTTTLHYGAGGDHGKILPWKSTMLRHGTLEKGESAALLRVRQRLRCVRDSLTTHSLWSEMTEASGIHGTGITQKRTASGWRSNCIGSRVADFRLPSRKSKFENRNWSLRSGISALCEFRISSFEFRISAITHRQFYYPGGF